MIARLSSGRTTSSSKTGICCGPVSIAGGGAVAVVDLLLIVHQLPGPVHSTNAQEEQRKPEGQAEEEISGVGPQRTEVEIRVPRNSEVNDGKPDR